MSASQITFLIQRALRGLYVDYKVEDVLMTVNGFALQEMQSLNDGPIVGISLLDIRVTGCKMRSNEAEISVVVVETNPDCSFVARHASQASLQTSAVSNAIRY